MKRSPISGIIDAIDRIAIEIKKPRSTEIQDPKSTTIGTVYLLL